MILTSLSSIWAAVAPAIGNHLWQSTLCLAMAGLLTLTLRKNHARVRYGVWLAASIKFLIPFSLLIGIGSHLARPRVVSQTDTGLFVVMEQVSQPFSPPAAHVISPVAHAGALPNLLALLPAVLLAFWLCGFVVVFFTWYSRWLRISATLRKAMALKEGREVDALRRVERMGGVRRPLKLLLSSGSLEPGIFGIVRPVLVWPKGISERLNDAQMEAIMAHEAWHVRRLDNLTAAIHMVVEAIFWFHPLVWWLGSRMVDERERACDEKVLEWGSERNVYAESVLKTCEFCVESPLACVSGVTGADLKKRIARIMTDRMASKLSLGRQLLLVGFGIAAVAGPIGFGLVNAPRIRAQSTQATDAQELFIQDMTGRWQGTLHASSDLRTVINISKVEGGGLTGVMYSVDQGGLPLVATVTRKGSSVKISVPAVEGAYVGRLDSDGKMMLGTWTQGPKLLALNLKRATAETAWTIPEPARPLKPMPIESDPVFDVATISPTKPGTKGGYYKVADRHFVTSNSTVSGLIRYAYEVHPRQITGGPAWIETDRYDVNAQPEGDGEPNDKQWKTMLQKLLADRFQLTFHREKKDLSVYAIVVEKTGPKLAKSAGDPSGGCRMYVKFVGIHPMLPAMNATMADFADFMQGVVTDRPVVDETGLSGRYDFTLNWTPDDSQFGGPGGPVSPPDNDTQAPDLFTAVQQQLGLRLDSTKAPVEVLVIDHIEKPVEN